MAIVPNGSGVPISPVTPLFDPHNATTNELEREALEAEIAAGAFGALLQDTATRSAAMTLLAITQGDVSGLVAALAGKAASAHTHVAADVTDFSSAVLALAAAIAHNHNASAITAGTLDVARIPTIPYSGVSGTPTISAFGATLIDDADAATALATLGLGSEASDVDMWTGSNTTAIVTPRRLRTSEVPVAIPFATTITLDGNAGDNFLIGTLTDNFTFANPTNFGAGKQGKIIFKQDATGSRVLSRGADWTLHNNTTLAAGPNTISMWDYFVVSAGVIRVNTFTLNYS